MATTVARHAGQFGSWEMISRPPHPSLRPHVRRYCGYAEDTLAPLARVEAATPDIPVIVSLGPGLAERLQDAPSWDARFELLDRLLARRIEAAQAPPPSVVWAWTRLTASHGRMAVGSLAAEIGCSPRYLTLQFREHLGMPPKALARVLRFRHALDRLENDDGVRFAEIAESSGYYDQAHLNRDFRAFAGAPPTDFLARRLPDGGGVAAEQFASVQDAPAAAA